MKMIETGASQWCSWDRGSTKINEGVSTTQARPRQNKRSQGRAYRQQLNSDVIKHVTLTELTKIFLHKRSLQKS